MDTALVSTKCRTSDTAMDGIEGDESGLLRAECAELGVEPSASAEDRDGKFTVIVC